MRLFSKKTHSKDDDDSFEEEPPLPTVGRPKLSGAFADELRASVHNSKAKKKKNVFSFLSSKKRSPSDVSSDKSDSKSPSRPKRRTISKEMADDLRKSFHERNANEDSHRVRPNTEARRLKARPRLSTAVADELRMSFHNRHAKKSNPRPSLSTAVADELRMSFHNRHAKKSNPRPRLSTAVADELRMSFHNRNAKKSNPRNERDVDLGIDHILREEDDSENDSYDKEPNRATFSPEYPGEDKRVASSRGQTRRPTLSREVADELRQSFVHRGARKQSKREEVISRIMKRRESERMLLKQSLDSTQSKEFDGYGSFAEEMNTSSNSSDPSNRLGKEKKRRKKGLVRGSTHSVESFDASFSDDGENTMSLNRDDPRATPSRNIRGSQDEPDRAFTILEEVEEIQGDFGTYKVERAQLMREKKKLKSELSTSKKKSLMLAQKVDDLRSEDTDLRKQLSNWQKKTSKISKLQSQERIKFGNSTDLIAQARVDLAKALNEKRMMKAQMNDLETSLEERDRRIHSLKETIEIRSEKVDDIAFRLKDTEAELRFNTEEKRRIEEELAVLVASRNGQDVGETIRHLEQEKSRWQDERERALEAKRIALDEENDRIDKRERARYRQEEDQQELDSEKTKRREGKHQKLQDAINRQLQDMKDANMALQEKLNSEHLESQAERKRKDRSMALLEEEVSKLKKKLASRNLQQKELEFRKAEADSAKDDLKDARKQNRRLDRQIESLTSEMEVLGAKTDDWKEVLMPGYRGVTLGSNSDSLAGFLTILIEEQSKYASRRPTKLSKISKHLKDEGHKSKGDQKTKKGEKSKRDKRRKEKSRSKSKDKDKKSSSKKKKDDKKKSKREIEKRKSGGAKNGKDGKEKRSSTSKRKSTSKDQKATSKRRESKSKQRESSVKRKSDKKVAKKEKEKKLNTESKQKHHHKHKKSDKKDETKAHRKRKSDNDVKQKTKSDGKSKPKAIETSNSKRRDDRRKSTDDNKHKSKSRLKVKSDAKRKAKTEAKHEGGKRVSFKTRGQLGLDQNLALMQKKRSKSKTRRDESVNDSVVAIKKPHRGTKKHSKKRESSGGRRSSLLSVVPPPTIILQ
jgi:hypothetical protein